MPDARRALTADERLAMLRRDRARLRRERMAREVAGPVWHRMVRVVPVLFRLEGRLDVRVMRAPREVIIEALREDAVFAVDTAMRLMHGAGFLAGGDAQAYLSSAEPLTRLAAEGLVDETPCPDTTLVRPWPGAPRLFSCITEELPSSRLAAGGHRVVTGERLRRELIGAVGARADLFALLERAEAAASGAR